MDDHAGGGAVAGRFLRVSVGRGRVVRAAWTDRGGGVSRPPYDSLNLAGHVGDAPEAVGENRRRLARALGLPDPDGWVLLEQVHGNVVLRVTEPTADHPPVADAALTTDPSLPLVVLVADCAPLLLHGPGSVGVVHAGWPGLLAGVVEAAVEHMHELAGGPVHAVLGPCVHPGRYEFGRSDLDRMVEHLGADVEARTDWGTPALDLPRAAEHAARRGGAASFRRLGGDTASDPALFSHRRDGTTGRQALVAVLEEGP